jgi:excisionase family DNA binding protein
MPNNQILESFVSSLTQALETAPTPDADEMLTIREVCDLLGFSRWTIRRLYKSGELQYIKLSKAKSGAVRIFRSSVRDFLERSKRATSHAGE